MLAALYTNVPSTTFVTVKLTLPVLLGIPVLDTAHRPLALVVHEAVLPPLHVAFTTAFASGPWLLVWTVTVTVAVHEFACIVLARSRSPTCMVGATTVMLWTCVPVAEALSVTVSVTV